MTCIMRRQMTLATWLPDFKRYSLFAEMWQHMQPRPYASASPVVSIRAASPEKYF